ncbi:MAG TPA: M14 family zinc carboxypeptidase [Solirubrobacterales bacterium]|nr:M14 family zinc carboxypeptidase [Solirubrobacterales bacterium]
MRTPYMEMLNRVLNRVALGVAAAALLACALAPAKVAGKGVGISPAPAGVVAPGSPYRYVTLNPKLGVGMPTIVQRIERAGGRIDRWWRLRGSYYLPAVAYDLSGGGLSGDGRTLLLQRFTPAYPPKTSRFAVLDTAVHLRHPVRPGEKRPLHAVRRIEIPGFYSVHAVSPDGTTAYLTRHHPRRSIAFFELRTFDLISERLAADPVADPGAPPGPMEGVPITRAVGPNGRWAYTLYDDNGGIPFLLGLDTATGELRKIELPQLRYRRALFLVRMRVERGGRSLVIFSRSTVHGHAPTPPLVVVDTKTFAVRDARTAVAAWGRHVLAAFADLFPAPEDPLLAFARTPRRPGNLLARFKVVGRSSEGRPISLRQVGDPRWSGELLVVGCIHGDECGTSRIEPLTGGCPDPSADVYLVPNLNPDGAAARSRLNGRGVDLNRNFPSEWKVRGVRWDPEYPGPKPFSEPETRLAARIIRTLQPEATIWFHQYRGQRPYVRAWGQSVAAARRFARLARMPFRAMRWPAGTAPNWQNHEFHGAASFVVELPDGRVAPRMRERVAKALVRMARWVRED